MIFYLFAFLLAFLQNSVISTLFPSFFLSPNILLSYLFLNLLREEDIKKVLISGLFLDLFQDSLGLNLSGFLLFGIGLGLLKEMFEFPSRVSLVVSYTLLSILEKSWTLLLYRWKYYIPLDPLALLLSYLIELSFLIFMAKGYITKQA